jgi:hypothetical protein
MMGLTLAERRAVTEMTAIRYVVADRRVKSRILDELCANTGWHRNHARKALKAALQPKVVAPEAKSASPGLRGGCDCCTYRLLAGTGDAGRQETGADVERTSGSVTALWRAGRRR